MMKKVLLLVAFSTVFLAGAAESKQFILSSENFRDGEAIPLKFTKAYGGENISPQLNWQNPPPGTRYYAISCIDTNPVAKRWVHWMIINIPAATTFLAEDVSCGNMPRGARELNNSFKASGWGGPRPPSGTGVHHYVFTIYALDRAVKTTQKYLSESMLLELLEGKVLAKAVITGIFEEK